MPTYFRRPWGWESEDEISSSSRGAEIMKPHKLVGRASNCQLHAALQQTVVDLKDMAAPRVTRIVRMENGIDVRDDDDELEELPSHCTVVSPLPPRTLANTIAKEEQKNSRRPQEVD